MASSNKTTNLNLNSWISTDKPKREDFVSDNTILDTVISTHIANTTLHFTTGDRALLSAPFEVGVWGGTGDASYVHTLSFSPKYVFVFLRNNPFIKYDSTNGYTIYNCGAACYNSCGASLGVSLSGAQLTLQQTQGTPTDGNFINLNKSLGQYVYIALK